MVAIKGRNTTNNNYINNQDNIEGNEVQKKKMFSPSFRAAVAKLKQRNESNGIQQQQQQKDVEVLMIQSDSKYTIFAVKLLLILVILFSLPKLVSTKKTISLMNTETTKTKNEKYMDVRMSRFQCQTNPTISNCWTLIPEESLNCIHQCMSKDCYATIYAIDPLQPGEIDIERAKEFESCVKQELRQQRIAHQQQR